MGLLIYFIKYLVYLLVLSPISNLGHFLINFEQSEYFLIYFKLLCFLCFHYFLDLFIFPNSPLSISISLILIPKFFFIPHLSLFINLKYLNLNEPLFSFQFHYLLPFFQPHSHFQFLIRNYLELEYFYQFQLLFTTNHLLIMNNLNSLNHLLSFRQIDLI